MSAPTVDRFATTAQALGRAVFGSTAAALTRLDGADRELRAALPVSRRIGFVSVDGGTGCTSTIASLGSLLARRRTGMVLAVDAAGGRAGLARQLGLASEPDSGSDSDSRAGRSGSDPDRQREEEFVRRSARTAAEARTGLSRTATGLYLLAPGPDRSTGPHGTVRADETSWAERVGPIARFYDLVLTDWGRRLGPEAQPIADAGHVVVVVGRSDPRSAAAAAELLDGLTGATRRLLLLVDPTGAGAPTASALRRGLTRPERAVVPVLTLPYEPARARTPAPVSRDFRARTRDAHLRLAAAVVGAAVRGRDEAGPVPATRAPSTGRAGRRIAEGAAS